MSQIVNLEVIKNRRGRPENKSFDNHIKEALTLEKGKAVIVEPQLYNTLRNPLIAINHRIKNLGHTEIKAYKQGDDIVIAKI